MNNQHQIIINNRLMIQASETLRVLLPSRRDPQIFDLAMVRVRQGARALQIEQRHHRLPGCDPNQGLELSPGTSTGVCPTFQYRPLEPPWPSLHCQLANLTLLHPELGPVSLVDGQGVPLLHVVSDGLRQVSSVLLEGVVTCPHDGVVVRRVQALHRSGKCIWCRRIETGT